MRHTTPPFQITLKVLPLAINALEEFVHAFLAELDRYLKVPVCPGASKILAELLNPAPTSAETVLEAIKFYISFDDFMVESLIFNKLVKSDAKNHKHKHPLGPARIDQVTLGPKLGQLVIKWVLIGYEGAN
jgi:hypothetical protein